VAGQEPAWWYETKPTWQATLLKPAASIYASVALRRLRNATPYRARLPVICVGNFTVGGTGKTPFAIALATLAASLGHAPWFLSRGYGGTLQGPIRVEPDHHTAAETGDEPLLLARIAPTVVARDRKRGAQFIENNAPQNAVIIMDDGLQNPALQKDLTVALVDRSRGIGNGLVLPAGPLRLPLAAQTGLADIIALTGNASGKHPEADIVRRLPEVPVIHTSTAPTSDTDWLNGLNVVAYAGIANPDRFLAMLEKSGARIVERRAFRDHQPLTANDAEALLAAAHRGRAELITTEKDLARLSGMSGALETLRNRSKILAIKTEFAPDSLAILKDHVQRAIEPRLRSA
jgi:tetraacyldisaccharide 4'-kinase